MSNRGSRAARGPVEGFIVIYVKYIGLKTCPYFDDLKMNVFDEIFLNATLSCLQISMCPLRYKTHF